MLPKLRFVTFSRVLRVSCILCGVLVLMVFTTSCQKGKDETVSKEKAEELSQTSKYMLDDEEVMEAIRSGITMDEINFLIYIARRADKPVSDLLALKRNGLSISEIDKQLSENDEGLNHQSEGGAKGYFVPSDPQRVKSVTNFKISDFRAIGHGMTISQVSAILDGRRPNKYQHTNTVRDVDVYELMAGGEVWISYSTQGTSDPVYRVEAMGYRNPKEPDKSIMLIKKLDMMEAGMVFQKVNERNDDMNLFIEKVKTLKKGMSKKKVEKRIGVPDETIPPPVTSSSGFGWHTEYYFENQGKVRLSYGYNELYGASWSSAESPDSEEIKLSK